MARNVAKLRIRRLEAWAGNWNPYGAFGEHDVVGIADSSDQVGAVALSAAINASGTTMIKLTPLVTVEEVDQAARK